MIPKSDLNNENGGPRFELIEAKMDQIEDTLKAAVHGLSESVHGLASEIGFLRQTFERAVPIKLVALMFVIMIGALFGIEAVKMLPKFIGL